ncbi:hypothetical protein GCM10007973_27050 [Polymorphobacter multimanifer]|uniref:DUF1491 family protein n=1 Tax=Polymorphobacter multimanifer TaxID=1070431 RepID=A0A841L4P5_9SPHN|nr:DUF1491 family protein [Polymorphobacter multimanifer]MBB6227390.1 hypothetical protein [Polymorphobacter multimanifer]GGI89250.1 hypothetical protein GCM10007973_27050 [Polymorphobacter multimanifer]
MRLAAGLKVSALLRTVQAVGGFGVVLARGDQEAGSIAVVVREGGEELLLAPVMALSGRYAWSEAARGEAVAGWVSRARQRDPDLWVVEIEAADAMRLVGETLGQD